MAEVINNIKKDEAENIIVYRGDFLVRYDGDIFMVTERNKDDNTFSLTNQLIGLDDGATYEYTHFEDGTTLDNLCNITELDISEWTHIPGDEVEIVVRRRDK